MNKRKLHWSKYLRSEQVPQKREMAFKIMLVTAMDLDTALDYLLACTMEPFSAREVVEVIMLFCVQEPDKIRALFAEDHSDLDRAMDDVCWKLRQLSENPSWM